MISSKHEDKAPLLFFQNTKRVCVYVFQMFLLRRKKFPTSR